MVRYKLLAWPCILGRPTSLPQATSNQRQSRAWHQRRWRWLRPRASFLPLVSFADFRQASAAAEGLQNRATSSNIQSLVEQAGFLLVIQGAAHFSLGRVWRQLRKQLARFPCTCTVKRHRPCNKHCRQEMRPSRCSSAWGCSTCFDCLPSRTIASQEGGGGAALKLV